jgi:phosphate transport system protein
MTLHFQREVDKLKKMILNEAALVESGLQKALKALRERDEELASEVKNSDNEVDMMEIEIEEEALKILALHQPVAIDLRFIVSVIKINNDLERIGDLTSNIAARTTEIADFPHLQIPAHITEMADIALTMVKESLDALVNLDVSLARKVCEDDEKVDELHRKTYKLTSEKVKEEPENITFFLKMLGISRYLERIADHSTNIAEDVMYMVEGKISRHQKLDA